jgi:WD40 repeat protein
MFQYLGNIKSRYTNDINAQELLTLTYPEILVGKDIQVTSLSWSANGSSVFVGYGSTSHEGLCMHKGAVCSWNIERYKINPNKPDMSVETNACVTAIAGHPERPGIVATGLYTGMKC